MLGDGLDGDGNLQSRNDHSLLAEQVNRDGPEKKQKKVRIRCAIKYSLVNVVGQRTQQLP